MKPIENITPALNIKLDDVPSSESLQARILNVTKDMPQQLASEGIVAQSLTNNKTVLPFRKRILKPIVPLALAASITLFTIFTYPELGTQTSLSPTVALQSSELSLDEIEFEEAMLLYDEWAFAQL